MAQANLQTGEAISGAAPSRTESCMGRKENIAARMVFGTTGTGRGVCGTEEVRSSARMGAGISECFEMETGRHWIMESGLDRWIA